MRREVCTECDWLTGNWTYVRQRIVCRRCWELMGRDPVRGEDE
jgi:transcription initiation factor TFIIIB Brf1 subunit/transcription initiation factor TFIIB